MERGETTLGTLGTAGNGTLLLSAGPDPAGGVERRSRSDRRAGLDRRRATDRRRDPNLWRELGKPGEDLRRDGERRSGNDRRRVADRRRSLHDEFVTAWQL